MHLTRREVQAVSLLLTGCTVKEIAAILELSTRTVYFHLENASRKVGASSQWGLLCSFATLKTPQLDGAEWAWKNSDE